MRRVASEQTCERLDLGTRRRIFHLDLARDDSHDVGDHARLELACALDRGHYFAVNEIRRRFEQFNRGRTVLHIYESSSPLVSCYSIRFSNSSSVSAVRRPILASSTLFTN